MRTNQVKQAWWLGFALVAVSVCFTATAHASTVANVASGAAGIASGDGAGQLADMLDKLITFCKGKVYQILVLAFLGVGLALAFNKNFLQALEAIAYIGAICCFLAWVMSGAGVSTALGAMVP